MIVVNNREELLIYTRNTAWWNRLNELDVSRVTDFSWLFVDEGSGSYSNFNSSSISNWDTSSAITMEGMLRDCEAFNQPLNFDTSSVTTMNSMLAGCEAFNQPVNFDTSNVTDMFGMFQGCDEFNQPVNFDTSKVTNMSWMFNECHVFNQPLTFDTRNVTNMSRMFRSCSVFNQNLSSWIVYCDVYKYDMFTGSAITPPEYSSYPWWSPDTCTPRPIKINYSNVMIF